MKRRGPIWLVILFCIPPVIITWRSPNDNTLFWLSFVVGFAPCLLLWLLYKLIARQREKRLYDERCERYIEALNQWADKHVDGK
jgi:protein-S-isoprenylcysteine O-methyltransferase Ste14